MSHSLKFVLLYTIEKKCSMISEPVGGGCLHQRRRRRGLSVTSVREEWGIKKKKKKKSHQTAGLQV